MSNSGKASSHTPDAASALLGSRGVRIERATGFASDDVTYARKPMLSEISTPCKVNPLSPIVSYIESKPRALVVPQRLVGVNHQAKSKFIETLFNRAEWLDGTTFEADDMNIDLGSRTKSYFSSYHFGNLPFSSGIKANHYPAVAQQSQLQNYYSKHNWAMMTANDGHGVDSVTKAWADTLKKARQLVTEGAKPDVLTGTFPCVAALFDKEEYEAAPMKSKWAVQFIYSARRQDYSFTSMAATYADPPDWIRPTELQAFVPHIDVLDCISWLYLRDYVIQHPEMKHGELQWLAACTSGVQVNWRGTIEEALCVDSLTGRKRFTAEAEATIRDLQKWSLAASYRAFMPGMDGQIPIGTAEGAGLKQT
ncbi:Conidial development fluffy [Fusarium acutatum]|uniref:Conidial development fluffy n=1 Tax=Fusarium acutatum TaxID=78861 RepID=A0A8H4K7I9_9HYPO|nr:Conidial development fluffy [Fusarium acutatum]